MPKISPISARQLRRIFEKAGFKCVRTKGDHFAYTKEGVIRPIIIKNNLRSAGISREEYFNLLGGEKPGK